MRSHKLAWIRRQRRGANAIEFALCLPVLLLFLGGICEYGLLFNQYLGLISSTRNGARWGANWTVDSGDSTAETVARVRDSLPLVGLNCTEDDERAGSCEVSATLIDVGGYDAVEVTTILNYAPIMGGLVPVPSTLEHSSAMILAQQSS